MKTILLPGKARSFVKPLTIFMVVMTALANSMQAQLADCSSGNVMYIIYNDSTAANAPSEIRPVTYATGAVGALMGGVGYTIKKKIGATTYYGSSSLAVDPTLRLFYVNTSMGFSGGPKDFIAINTLAATQTVIATSPSTSTANVPNASGLDNYFFVKMAISPVGNIGYAIGVSRDTTITTPATANPLISFTPCATAGCSTIKLLGYLPATPQSQNWNLYNGDIAFNSTGDLYYLSAAYSQINGSSRYNDIRLFKIDALNIPSVPGTGIIPMSFIADYNSIDSTVLNGVAFDPTGGMYISTRRFNGPQNPPLPTYVNELYKSTGPGATSIIPGFGPKTAGYAAADLASCFFPLVVLDENKVKLSGKYSSGQVNLTWGVNNNTNVSYYEIQRGDDGVSFETVGQLSVKNPGQGDQTYIFNDPQSGFGKPAYYRIRQVMNSGARVYSNVLRISFNSKINLVSKPKPNPFISYIDVSVQLKAASTVTARLSDQSGRLVYSHNFGGQVGENKLTLDNVGNLRSGIYILELTVDDEIIREKLIKQ